jgi:hypothetical protein
LSANATVSLYPNPASESTYLTVDFEGNADLEAEIANARGKHIRTESLQKGQNRIPVQELESGLYIITLKTQNQVVDSYKFIKN